MNNINPYFTTKSNQLFAPQDEVQKEKIDQEENLSTQQISSISQPEENCADSTKLNEILVRDIYSNTMFLIDPSAWLKNIEEDPVIKQKISNHINFEDFLEQTRKIIEKNPPSKEEQLSVLFKNGELSIASGKYTQGIEYYKHYLSIAGEIEVPIRIQIYSQILEAYTCLSDWKNMHVYFNELKSLCLNEQNPLEGEARGIALRILGAASLSIGEVRRALEYSKDALEFLPNEQHDSVYCMIGACHNRLKEPKDAIDSLRLGIDSNPLPAIRGRLLINLSIAYRLQEKWQESAESCEEALTICLDHGNELDVLRAYNGLGIAYVRLKEYQKAEDRYKEGLELAKKSGHMDMEIALLNNLASNVVYLEKYDQAAEYLKESSNLALKRLQALEISQWKISLFEEYYRPMSNREEVLRRQEKMEEALVVSDARRAPVLADLLFKRNPSLQSSSLSPSQMQEIAKNLNTTLVIYTLAANPTGVWVVSAEKVHFEKLDYDEGALANFLQDLRNFAQEKEGFRGRGKDESLSSLVITNAEKEKLQELFKDVCNSHNFVPTYLPDYVIRLYTAAKRNHNNPPSTEKLFEEIDPEELNENIQKSKDLDSTQGKLKEDLHFWYKKLIAPIEDKLFLEGADSIPTLTFVGDGDLSEVPFNILCDAKGKYLIEKCALSFAPSINVLNMIQNHAKQDDLQSVLLVGNPDTGNEDNLLEYADQEIDDIENVFKDAKLKSQSYKGAEATIDNLLKQLSQADYIHLACHGEYEKPYLDAKIDDSELAKLSNGEIEQRDDNRELPGDYDPHTVFEGFFRLAPESKNHVLENSCKANGFLTTLRLSELSLKAELVFLSTCHSGRGKSQKEGIIGPVWAFLAGGATSVISTYWPLPERAQTVEMVKEFYAYLLKGESKAHALRKASLKAIKENRDDFTQWGVFFLSGCHTTVKRS